jgi:cytochrome c5
MSSSEHAAVQHEAFIKTPKQLITVVVLAFVVPILLIIFLAQLVTGGMKTSPSNPELNADAVRSRIAPVAQLKLAGTDGPKVLQTGEQVYKAVCAACHQTGLLNAPKVGDNGTWGKLIKEGLKTITADAIKGVRQMPARGGNPDLDDIEVERAVVYMANLSGAKWTEPADAKPAAATAPAAASGTLPAKVFFEVGKFVIPADSLKAIAAAADSLKAGTGKVDITGYTDKSGNAAQNAELAKERAKAVREALEKAGIARDRINMRPPVEITGSQNDNEARRVEINLGV